MELTIYIRYQNEPERKWQTSDDEIVIGRPKNIPTHLDLSPDLKVSRPHARLFYELNCWWVQDLHSKHKTFLNGEAITTETPLSPGDELRLGDTHLRMEFVSLDTHLPAGFFDTYTPVNELESSPRLTQDTQTDLLARVARIAGTYPESSAMWQLFIEEIAQAFPQAEHIGIILVHDDEPFPVAYYPAHETAHLSYTLIGRAIRSRRPVSWVRDLTISASRPASSLFDTNAAACVPMLFRSKAVGAIYLGSTGPDTEFAQDVNLARLGETANLMAAFTRDADPGFFASFPSVFVSYALPDRKFVDRLAADLRCRQIRVWYDERLQVGDVRRAVIGQAIRSTGAFVVVLSPDSVENEEVLWEVDQAGKTDRPILPLMYHPCTPPEALSDLHSLDFVGDMHSDNLQKLVSTINRVSRPSLAPAAQESETRILFLAANPLDQDQLRLDREHRVIKEALQASKYGDRFMVEFAGAARPRDFQDNLRRFKPHIVHFSGHGGRTSGRIVLEDDEEKAQVIPTPALNQVFRIFKYDIRCVILNACLSATQAEAIKEEVGCVVGMSSSIDDDAAIMFADSFYRTIGDAGSMQQAFDAGCNLVAIQKPGNETFPQLLAGSGVNPATMFFV